MWAIVQHKERKFDHPGVQGGSFFDSKSWSRWSEEGFLGITESKLLEMLAEPNRHVRPPLDGLPAFASDERIAAERPMNSSEPVLHPALRGAIGSSPEKMAIDSEELSNGFHRPRFDFMRFPGPVDFGVFERSGQRSEGGKVFGAREDQVEAGTYAIASLDAFEHCSLICKADSRGLYREHEVSSL